MDETAGAVDDEKYGGGGGGGGGGCGGGGGLGAFDESQREASCLVRSFSIHYLG